MDAVLLAVFDGDGGFAVFDEVALYEAFVAVSPPNSVGTIADQVALDAVARKSDFDAIGGGVAEVVAKQVVVVAAAFSAVHGALAGP